MPLPSSQYHLFMDTHLSLLHYVSIQEKLVPRNTTFNAFLNYPSLVKFEAREKLIANDRLRTTYLRTNAPLLPVESIQILSDMSRRIVGNFYIHKLLRNRAVWFDESDRVFIVHDLSDPFDSLVGEIPCVVRASILPLFNKVIYDGFLQPFEIQIEPPIRKSYTDKYRQAKEIGLIHTSM